MQCKKSVWLLQYFCNKQNRSYVEARCILAQDLWVLTHPICSSRITHTSVFLHDEKCLHTTFTFMLVLNQCQKLSGISCFHRRSKVEKTIQKGCYFFNQSHQSGLGLKTWWLMTAVCNVYTFHRNSGKVRRWRRWESCWCRERTLKTQWENPLCYINIQATMAERSSQI